MADFDISGKWDAIQTNGFVAKFDMGRPRQEDGAFSGTGTHSNGSVVGAGFGQVQGDEFRFRINWSNGTSGAYNGVFLQGVVNGSTFDINNPEVFAGWKSSKAFSLM